MPNLTNLNNGAESFLRS